MLPCPYSSMAAAFPIPGAVAAHPAINRSVDGPLNHPLARVLIARLMWPEGHGLTLAIMGNVP
jgi:hypothetical protein